jgi:hypothetical protein
LKSRANAAASIPRQKNGVDRAPKNAVDSANLNRFHR